MLTFICTLKPCNIGIFFGCVKILGKEVVPVTVDPESADLPHMIGHNLFIRNHLQHPTHYLLTWYCLHIITFSLHIIKLTKNNLCFRETDPQKFSASRQQQLSRERSPQT